MYITLLIKLNVFHNNKLQIKLVIPGKSVTERTVGVIVGLEVGLATGVVETDIVVLQIPVIPTEIVAKNS